MTIQELIAGASLTRAQLNQVKRNLATFSANKLRGLAEDVARAEDGSIMTRAGLNILAKGIAGKLIHFTRVAIGDSMQNDELVELTDEQILDLTDLINPLQDVPIVGCQSTGGGVAVVQAYISNANFQSGFWCREMGLFAKDPDTNQEVLYSYRNTGLLSSYTPGNQGAVIVNRKVNLVTVVQNAQNITATIDASVVFVNQAELLEHVYSDNPHPNLPIGDYNASITQLDNRVTKVETDVAQVENNVANLFMQLDAPDANLLVFEDFKDLDSVDTLKVKVTNTVAGAPDVYVESLDGIRAGHYYTLSDGVHSWYIRSNALASNDGLFSVIFDQNITQTFNLNKTYLYRSTALIEEGLASGSSTQRESVFAPDDVFSGVAASSTQTLTLKTTQANAANFEFNGAFNSGGFFTLA